MWGSVAALLAVFLVLLVAEQQLFCAAAAVLSFIMHASLAVTKAAWCQVAAVCNFVKPAVCPAELAPLALSASGSRQAFQDHMTDASVVGEA
jgi:hypothetical protein